MNLSGILSVAGHSGLFKLVGQMKNGMLVESMLDGRRMPAYATQRVLYLEEISIYTQEEDMPLAEVFDLLAKKSKNKPTLDSKKSSVDELRAHLKLVLPNYDEERVYSSDIKKLFQWYNILAQNGLVGADKKEKSEEEKESSEKSSETKKTKKEDKVAKEEGKKKGKAKPSKKAETKNSDKKSK